jgi:replicative DNA helicase
MSDLVQINASNYMPASRDAERSILGAILLNNTAFNEAAGEIASGDFSLDAHRRIFTQMAGLAADSKAIDTVTLTDALDRAKELDGVGGVGYLASLIEGVPDRPSIEHYIGIVKDNAQRRSLLLASKLTIERIVDGEQTKDVAAGLLGAVLDVETQTGRSRGVEMKVFMGDLLRELETQSASEGLIGLPTGLRCLDTATGGLRAGELVVIGARPGAGKSALASQIAMANAECGNYVGFFSLEMSRWDLGRRFLCAVTDVPAFMIRDPRRIGKKDAASSARWRSLAAGAGKIADWPLSIDDNGSLTISEIMARAKLLIDRNGAKLIIVDYLQLVRADVLDIRERVSKVADSLRLLAKSEGVAVVLLSQLRRPERINDEPTLIDLKESGDIEAHAHVVLLIHSPVGPDMKPALDGQKIIVAKNRNGVRGQEPVVLHEAKLMFFSRTDVGDHLEWRQAPRQLTSEPSFMAMS